MRKELMALAAAQGGVFTRRQALAAGYGARAVRNRLAAGVWLARRRGVYVTRALWNASDAVGRHAIDVAAVILSFRRSDAVGSHRSAARVYGIESPEPTREVVTVTRPAGAPGRGASRGVHVERSALPRGHVRWERGVPLTAPARTVVDLARTLPFRDGVVVADSALFLRRTGREALLRVIEDCGRWPGIDRARAVIDFADPRARSPLESVTRVMFAEQGLPPPEVGVLIGEDDEIFTEVDFLWSDQRTIAEADGLAKYTDPGKLRAEKLKQERLEEMGFTVVRLTWRQVTEHPEESAARIRRAFVRGTARVDRAA
ncbi:type IV toxin-antitoxin system AbiEi family antitoxin domain-containing protein [Actinoallomurus soli]|uniref:type IV toxin-antitoxin system AbiEi family antitoxin domain-containing protein n=1 Tax=Actinoallomurus soli TaxID=2952535 RepID=UPI0020929DE6|nr:type IV toxin-antitoxin system AbiEi family antitoxin domain-containing protein [Actinoallomurus soli]MCO5974003.1 type IV toxin-antitoxin system AbiEi family antitoxin domain-containing protein [Actinoallomurus soli]